MRLWGFRRDPAPTADNGSQGESFECEALCRRGAELVHEERAARHCALPGFDTRTWHRAPERLYPIHMGRRPRYDLSLGEPDPEGKVVNWAKPEEDIFDEGCPGAWYRTPFVLSLLRYYRRPCGDGGRVANTLLDRCADEWIHDAIRELEWWEAAWQREHSEALFARMRARNSGGADG